MSGEGASPPAALDEQTRALIESLIQSGIQTAITARPTDPPAAHAGSSGADAGPVPSGDAVADPPIPGARAVAGRAVGARAGGTSTDPGDSPGDGSSENSGADEATKSGIATATVRLRITPSPLAGTRRAVETTSRRVSGSPSGSTRATRSVLKPYPWPTTEPCERPLRQRGVPHRGHQRAHWHGPTSPSPRFPRAGRAPRASARLPVVGL
jgi:hypothetical protein